jgi:CPA2 family monovalent cation:H+ antiporter-2
MPHDIALISTISAALGVSLVLGLLAARLHLPPLVGYLAAGVMIGPFTPGFVGDASLAAQLAEIGVMLLMFGVGLHFSIADLLAVKRIAVPGAILQIGSATLMGAALAVGWGWSWTSGLVFGLSLSVASTVVLLRALEARNSVNTHEGRVAVGWLVVEDLFMVVALVLLPPLARSLGGSEATPDESLFKLIAQTLLQISGFVAFMLLIGKKLFPAILTHVARTGSRELFTLSVVAAALGIAYAAAKVFGVSFALGAFFAGVVLRESHLSHRAAEQTLPLRDAFSVLFFASVGMLFDPRVLMTHPAETLAVVGVIMIGKSIAAMGLVLALRYPLSIALTVAASLAQIGEFSFILGGVGMHLGLLSPLAHNLILAGAILSIALNPLLFKFNDWVIAKSADNHHLQRIKNRWGDPLATIPEDTPAEGLRQQVIVAGYGRIGRRVASRLRENQVDVIVIDQNRELIEKLRQQGLQAVAGDATEPGTLIQAHVAHASMLVLTMPDIVGIARIIDTAVALQPAIRVIVRSHGRDESSLFENQPAVTVISSENALADQIAAAVLPPANSL